MSKRVLTCILSVVVTVGLVSAPAQAAARPGPKPPSDAPALAGRNLLPAKPLPDPASGMRLSKPDKVVWPAPSTRDGLETFDRSVSQRAGASGPVLKVRQAVQGRVTVSYAEFAHAYGGDWGPRLRLVALPDCALSTPHLAQCRSTTPLKSTNDTEARTVSAVAQPGMVLALEAGGASAQGDYKATSLAAASSWDTSLSSGAFSWNHSIRTPSVPGGLSPQVSLGYSSQTVDGRTSATNNQGSWLGEGFSYEPGFIERRYKPCADDGHTNSAEQCWAFQNATIMMSGRSGELVKVDDNNWKLLHDDGSKIERLAGASNGDNDGEHWRVTTTDGTSYYFGLGHLPGWSAGNEETESTWTHPVYGDDAGEPCYSASGFNSSHCAQAWRWNLDYVVDPRGNVQSYFYDKEVNHYAQGGRTNVDGTAYTRGGYLARIDYGQRDGQVYATNAAARVVFSTEERCIPGSACTAAVDFPDVPSDMICASSTHCTDRQTATTFFTRKRLAKIGTEVSNGAGWTPVESWTLEHEFKRNDDQSRTLWLNKIVHSGHWGGATIAEPAIELGATQLPNRVDSATDGIGPLYRYRLATVTSGTGSQMSINYTPIDCVAGATPAPENNTRHCYPTRWNPFGGAESNEVVDWFHKYLVASIHSTDLVGGSPPMITSYEYAGDGGWAKAKPDGITKDRYLTWNDWRGHGKVTVRNGSGRVDHVLLRGLGGTVADSTGKSYSDIDAFAGHELETTVYNGPDVVSKTINEPWRHVTHTHNESWGVRESALVRTTTTRKLTALAAGGWHETQTVTRYEHIWGRATHVSSLTAAGDTCTQTWYADNDDKHMHSFVSRTQTVAVACDLPFEPATQLLSDTRVGYDLQAAGVAPAYGTPTRNEALDRLDNGNVVYLVVNDVTSLDAFGRPLSAKDALGYETTSAYTQTNGLTTKTETVNALGHKTTTTMDPAFGQATAVIDPNGKRTDVTYDALGRTTAVWLKDRSKALNAEPNLKFSYRLGTGKAPAVITERRKNISGYRATYEIYDGHLRPRQTQAPTLDAGVWLLADTFYNDTGQVATTYASHVATGNAGDMPIIVSEPAVPARTHYAYDGAGRATTQTLWVKDQPQWSTITSYGGDRVHVDPPAGGIPTTTVTDVRGNKTELHQHHGSGPSGPADITRYAYTPGGQLQTVTDSMGNIWHYEYDLRQQKTRTIDPDSGAVNIAYDAAGQQTSVTDARNIKLSTKYDALGRAVETWQGEIGSGTRLTWSQYDTIAKGKLYYTARATADGNYYVKHEKLDKLYRPIQTRYTIPGTLAGSALSYVSYDFTTDYHEDATVKSIGMPAVGGLNAEVLVPTYDALQRPTALTGGTSYVTTAAYSDIGQLRQAELHIGGANKKTWLGWDYEEGTGRLAKSTLHLQGDVNPVMDTGYEYHPSGDIKSIADTPIGGQRDVQCFSYDRLQRLVDAYATGDAACDANATVGGPAPYHHSWTFDDAGNRTSETRHGTTDTVRTYHYPAAGQSKAHTLTSVTSTGPEGGQTADYTYDASGNTKTRPGQTLTWDPEGRLASVTPTGGQPTSFGYDGTGARIVRKEPGATTVYLPGMELRVVGASVSATRSYTFAGQTVAVRTASGVTFQAADHHGTSVASIDAISGSATWRRSTPYGETRGTAPATWPDQKGFVGGTQDGTTGLTQLGARSYDPAIGRFISVDPILVPGEPQSMNPYSYGNSSPATTSDPSGTCWVEICGSEGGSTSDSSGQADPCSIDEATCSASEQADYEKRCGGPKGCEGPPCSSLFLYGKCIPKGAKYIRPGNEANGSTKYALDIARKEGLMCYPIGTQIYCFGAYGVDVLQDMPGMPTFEITTAMTVGDVVFYPGGSSCKHKAFCAEKHLNTHLLAEGVYNTELQKRYGSPADEFKDTLRHEAIHSDQWASFDDRIVAFYAISIEAGKSMAITGMRGAEPDNGLHSNFEQEAGLYWGGYKVRDETLWSQCLSFAWVGVAKCS